MSEHPEEREDSETDRPSPGGEGDEPGAIGSSGSRDQPPAVPAEDDDTEAGDTDQHSSSGA